MSQYNKNKHK